MDFHHLDAVITVADERNFSRAAQRLHTSQPSLSQLIKRVEKELGAELFDRRALPLRLTKAGDIFVPRARKLVADYAGALADIRSAGTRSQVTVGTTPMLSSVLIPDLLDHILRLELSITINPLESPSRELVDLLQRGLIDLAVVSQTAIPESFTYEPVARSGFKVAMHHDIRARFPGPRIPIDDLLSQPLLLPKAGGVRTKLDSFLSTHGVKGRVAYESSSIETLLGLVEAGLGVAFVLETFITDQRAEKYSHIDFVPLEDGPEPLALGIATRGSGPSTEPIEQAKEQIRQSIRRLFPAPVSPHVPHTP